VKGIDERFGEFRGKFWDMNDNLQRGLERVLYHLRIKVTGKQG
jgi:hypothetical protein